MKKHSEKVSRLMTTNCLVVESIAGLEDLKQLFDNFPNLFIPVVRGTRFVGVILRSDFFDHYLVAGEESLRAADLISKEMIHLSPEDSLEEAREIFNSFDYPAIPIVDAEGDLVGILNKSDVESWFLDQPPSTQTAAPSRSRRFSIRSWFQD
ncbi:MAG: CBS domain-containing protein [Bacteroidetes bacterium]|nr:MAG: CBS domain-containing protein [Bacteroidota bacterium]